MTARELVATMAGLPPSTPAHHVVRSVITRGQSLNMPLKKIVATASKYSADQAVIDLLSDHNTVTRIASQTAKHSARLAAPSSAGAGVAPARLLVARLLTESGLTYSDRAVHTWLCLARMAQLEEDGRVGVMASRDKIAVALGLSVSTAGLSLSRLVDAGAIRAAAKRPGMAVVYKINRLSNPAERTTALDHYDLIGALAAGDTDHPGVTEIMGVADPRWGYTDLSHRHWLLTVAEAAGYPAPMSEQSVRRTRRQIRETTVDLDAATAARDEAEAARQERAAARVEELSRHRESWKQMQLIVDRVEAKGKARKALDPESRERWLARLGRLTGGVDPEHRSTLARVLRSHLRRAGWPPELVESAVGSLSTPAQSSGPSEAERAMVEWVRWLESQVGRAADAGDRAAWLSAAASRVGAVPEAVRPVGARVLAEHLVGSGWAPESKAAVDHLFGVG